MPDNRTWFDLKINGMPVNIKISKCNSSDNAQCKMGMYFAFTGHTPEFSNQIGWGTFNKRLKHGLLNISNKVNDVDYYFLVFNKITNDIYFCGLKELSCVNSNASNLPFQINWSKNKVPKINSYKASYNMIIGAYIKSANDRGECALSIKENEIGLLE